MSTCATLTSTTLQQAQWIWCRGTTQQATLNTRIARALVQDESILVCKYTTREIASIARVLYDGSKRGRLVLCSDPAAPKDSEMSKESCSHVSGESVEKVFSFTWMRQMPVVISLPLERDMSMYSGAMDGFPIPFPSYNQWWDWPIAIIPLSRTSTAHMVRTSTI